MQLYEDQSFQACQVFRKYWFIEETNEDIGVSNMPPPQAFISVRKTPMPLPLLADVEYQSVKPRD